MTDTENDPTTADELSPKVIDTRRREMAVEHIVFGTVRFLAQRHPELLDELDASLEHLWDHEQGAARDDDAVRKIAQRMLKSLRKES